tara:strand:- start:27445 stop:27876 length:432 start_codon:yes stop_codon:yes gene_type:complete
MELIETAKYIEMIDSMKGKYRLGFSQEKQKFAFQQKERGSSKIEGMILGGSDYMVSWSLFGDILGDGIGGGFDIQGRLYDINEQEFQKVLGLARTCSVCGDKKTESRWMKEIDSDVGFLRDAEKTIYDAGLVLPAPVSRMELV